MSEGWTSLAVQWLRFCASIEVSMGSIPGQGTKIHMLCGQKKKKATKKKLQEKRRMGPGKIRK